jgi:hypothetical protein
MRDQLHHKSETIKEEEKRNFKERRHIKICTEGIRLPRLKLM